jgi:hypothetical protein
MSEHAEHIIDNLSRLIMIDLTRVASEQHAPMHSADLSDDLIADGKARVREFRRLRAAFEDVFSGVLREESE